MRDVHADRKAGAINRGERINSRSFIVLPASVATDKLILPTSPVRRILIMRRLINNHLDIVSALHHFVTVVKWSTEFATRLG